MSTKPHIERIWCVCVMLIINNLENKSMRGTKHAYLEKYQLYQECMSKDPFHICNLDVAGDCLQNLNSSNLCRHKKG